MKFKQYFKAKAYSRKMPDLFRSQGKSVPLFFPLRALPLLDLIRPGSRLIVHPLESKLTLLSLELNPEAEFLSSWLIHFHY
jgi:hypothetical protein